MAESKPRILQGNRDMFWSVMVLMVIVGIFAGVTGQCSFSPSGPEQGPIREFDAQASLSDDARTLGFPIRSPEVPEGWTSNSGRVQPLGASTSSHVGWVTGERSYIELIQTDAPEDSVRMVDGEPRPSRTMVPISGREWSVYTGYDVRPLWVLDMGDTRVAVTGSAPTSEFETLASAVQDSQPLPAN